MRVNWRAFITLHRCLRSTNPFYRKMDSICFFVTDLESNGRFEYEGIGFSAYMPDESSVWNELIKLADLDKGDMKKLSADEMCAMIGESSKQIMGAV